jgi:hypothetical protein
MVKLTKPQMELLTDVSQGKKNASTEYAPAKKLVSLGLCVWNCGKFGSSWLELTGAGRAALNDEVGK